MCLCCYECIEKLSVCGCVCVFVGGIIFIKLTMMKGIHNFVFDIILTSGEDIRCEIVRTPDNRVIWVHSVGVGHRVYSVTTPGIAIVIQFAVGNISLLGFGKSVGGGYKGVVEHVRPNGSKFSF